MISMRDNKLNYTIDKLNTIIDFVDENEKNEMLKSRYNKVLRFQKALIRDIERKGRKIPIQIPSVCEITGCEVNSIREKEPPFKLEENLCLSYGNTQLSLFIQDTNFPHNTYLNRLGNLSVKYVKKQLKRKIVIDDLSSIDDNLILIMEVMKHREYYKKYFNIRTFEKRLDDIETAIKTIKHQKI